MDFQRQISCHASCKQSLLQWQQFKYSELATSWGKRGLIHHWKVTLRISSMVLCSIRLLWNFLSLFFVTDYCSVSQKRRQARGKRSFLKTLGVDTRLQLLLHLLCNKPSLVLALLWNSPWKQDRWWLQHVKKTNVLLGFDSNSFCLDQI